MKLRIKRIVRVKGFRVRGSLIPGDYTQQKSAAIAVAIYNVAKVSQNT